MQNPYRRALLLASVEETETEWQVLFKYLGEILPEMMTDLTDAQTTFLVNSFRSKGSRTIKSIFKRRPKKKDDGGMVVTVPDKDGNLIKVKVG